ncbi:MAG TPA: ATP-binding protein [Nitrospiraceae bacterium]|nr:ATP-binding protein [Nitrospiraceae bacterium]
MQDTEHQSGKPDRLDTYEEWRDRFAVQRLTVLYIVGLIANPVFGILDLLIHHESLSSLFIVRTILESGLLIGFLGLRLQIARFRPTALLAFWILFANVCVVHMTVLLGGFSSQYYNGLNLVMLAAAVIVPVSWRGHLAAQLGTLLYYYSANLAAGPGVANVSDVIQNSFFLVWTCVALIIAVVLYERLQRAEFQARRKLESSNHKLLELDRLKSEFFANISHELRTPLTLSMGAYQGLLASPVPADYRDIAAMGLRNTARLVSLIDELLDLAKLDSGHATPKKRSIDLAALVRDVASNFESSARPRIHGSGLDAACPIEADPRQLKKVLYNLLSNAVKFSDPASGHVRLRLRKDDKMVEFEVQDNGIGIPADQVDRIFDRFTQVEQSPTRRFGGAGIGLALVKEIVLAHAGSVMVASELGRGSTFRVALPIGQVDLQAVTPHDDGDSSLMPVFDDHRFHDERQMNETSGDGTKPTVVVADDNPDMRAYLHRLLNGPYHVVLARDGIEALEHARCVRPEVILTDVMMPAMSGYDLLKAVRLDQALHAVPVIFLTAKAGADARVESFAAGADDYLSKPFHEDELLARVNNQVRIHRQEQQLETRTAELEHLNQELAGLNDKLKEANERKSEFVSIVSHDLRSPMTAIQGYVDNMLDGLAGELTEKQNYYLTRIKANVERITRMVTELLDLARIEAGQITLRLQPVSLAELVSGLLEGLEPIAREKQLRIISSGEASVPPARCDPDKTVQIYTNLLQNAVKFTPRGGEVRVELECRDGVIRSCVADTGSGIPPSDIPKIFEKFYRGSSDRSETRGIGLGLAIVKHLVELQQGAIWVESVPGQGSRFFFTLPLHHA